MDASVRDLERVADQSARVVPRLSGLRVALVHDWLTGMRGGEKCLEVLCRAFPDATLYTLIHRRGSLSPAIEAMAIRTSPLQRIPGVFRHYRTLLPLMPLAARAWRLGDGRPRRQPEPLRGQGGRACPPGVPARLLLLHADALRLAGPRRLPRQPGRDRPVRRAAGRTAPRPAARLGPGDRRPGHALRGDLGDGPRAGSPLLRPREPGDPAAGRRRLLHPGRRPAARRTSTSCVSALVPYKRIDQAVTACTALGPAADRHRRGPRAGPARARWPGRRVRFLGWQPDEVIRDHYRRCRALLFPGEEDFGIVPVEALACGRPVIALGRGGAAETVDDRVGRTYAEPTAERPRGGHRRLGGRRPARTTRPLARRRAEALALPVFRDRLLGLLAGCRDAQR